jgi:hypothetical protein
MAADLLRPRMVHSVHALGNDRADQAGFDVKW